MSAKAILPVVDTIAKAQKIYEFELSKLREKLAGPVVEASEVQIAEVRTKLAGLPATARFAKILQSIDRGSDLVVAAVVNCDPFLADFVSDAEKSVLLENWQRARMPEEYAQLKILESDAEHLERTGQLLESFQRACFNSSISAREVVHAQTNQRGAPGPVPINRGAAMSLEARAAAVTAAMAGR